MNGPLQALLDAIPRPTSRQERVRGPRPLALRWALGWVALVAGFAAWTRLAPIGSGTGLPGTRWGLAAIAAVALARGLYRQRRVRAVIVANDRGTSLLPENRLADAVARYGALTRSALGLGAPHALVVGNRGVVAIAEGDFMRAEILLAEALRSGWLVREVPSPLGGFFAAHLARALALAGKLPEAQAWLACAAELLPTSRKSLLLPADAIILLRSGRAAEAAERIASGWMGAEGELPAHERRALRAFHALALRQVPSREEDCQLALAGLWPVLPGQLDHLGNAWPELAAFLVDEALLA